MTGQIVLSNSVLVIAATVLLYAALTDLKHYRIPNELIAVLAALFVLHALFSGRWLDIPWNAGLALLVLAVMLYFYAQNLMGGGDVKLLTIAFLWVGIECALPFAVLLAMFATLHAIAGKLGWAEMQDAGADKRPRIAFAPSIAAALVAVFMLGCLTPS
jgi:prepilin peptidase CpaA